MNKVLVVGGYGQVGRVAARALTELFPERVIVAGRDAVKAEACARSLGGDVGWRVFDTQRAGPQPRSRRSGGEK